jgi:hypothetical protein
MAHPDSSFRSKTPAIPWIFAAAFFLFPTTGIRAQENAPGPLQPPPEHNVKRVVGIPEPEAPPALPPAEIIDRLSKKEEAYQSARPTFAYQKTIRIQEFGPDGRPTGEFAATYEGMRAADGKQYERAIAAPTSTLQYLQFEPEDAQKLTHIPAYALIPSQISKYKLDYLNTEKVDEIDCYIFQVSPKTLERQHPLFEGVIWVDQKYLEVVKTYGEWVTDLGALHPPSLPFQMFETYRDNVDGKYWFPNYSRADGVYKMKERDVPIRVTIKWTNFKPLSAVAVPAPPAANPNAPATPASPPNAPPATTSPAPQP